MNVPGAFALAITAVLLHACAVDPVRTSPADGAQTPPSLGNLRAQARALRYSGRYAEAVERLQQALAHHPRDLDLQAEIEQTRLSWRHLRAEIGDRMLVLESEARRRRLPLLRKLVRADPDDSVLRGQMIALEERLGEDAAQLSECGRRQVEENDWLARRCLQLALETRASDTDTRRLAQLESAPKPKPQPQRPPPRAAAAPPSAQPVNTEPPPELRKALRLIEQGKLFGAVRILENMAQKDRDTVAGRLLLDRTRAELDRETRKMLEAGDQLYREGQVQEALAVWQAALNMDPFNPEARQKSERAMKVLSNLRELERQPHP